MTPVVPSAPHIGAELVAAIEAQGDPVLVSVSPDGLVMSEWELTREEMLYLMAGGRIRLWQHTGGDPMQPINVEVVEPVEEMEES